MKTKLIAITVALIALLMPATAWADWEGEYVDGVWVEHWVGDAAADVQTVTYEPSVTAEQFEYLGVVTDDEGRNWTYYDEAELPGDGLTALNSNGRHVDDNGYVVDGQGYIAFASPNGQHEIGTVIASPMGLARCYDVCPEGNYDLYVSFARSRR